MKQLVTISQFASILPISIGLIKWKRSHGIIHLVVGILGTWLIAESIQYLTRANNIRNLWISYALTPFQLILIGLYYKQLIPKRKMLVIAIFGIGLLIALMETIWRPLDQLNSVSLLYQCFTIVLIGALAFYDMLYEGEFAFVCSNAAFILLFLGSAVYYSAFLKLDNMPLLRMLSTGHTILLLIVYSLFTIEVWKQ